MKYKTLEEAREYISNIAEELAMFAEIDKMEMLRLLGQYAENIVPLQQGDEREDNFVEGCISNVYLAHSVEKECIYFRGQSDTLIVRAYLAILIVGLSGLLIEDFLHGSREIVEEFCERTDIRAQLTTNRANAFGNIYTLMRQKAQNERKE